MAYASPLPKDRSLTPMQEYPAPILAKVTTVSENAAASAVITLGANTTALEVGASGGPGFIKWIASTGSTSVISIAGTANFDHFIPTNSYRRFVVPIEKFVQSSVAGLNVQNGLYGKVAYIGTASILATEY